MPQTIKRSEFGLAGAIIILAQALTNFHSSTGILQEVESLKASVHQLKVDQEKYLVKKDEFKQLVTKLDKVCLKLGKISHKKKKSKNRASINRADTG